MAVFNKEDAPVKPFTVYPPPAKGQGMHHQTKQEAEAAGES